MYLYICVCRVQTNKNKFIYKIQRQLLMKICLGKVCLVDHVYGGKTVSKIMLKQGNRVYNEEKMQKTGKDGGKFDSIVGLLKP